MPDFDAAAVERLTAAGAILLGKLNTWEFGTGLGDFANDAAYPHARNPWKDDYFTGGSSTGSGAAVAAGTAMFALGSDTGGSIRAPAAFCGVQGMKPTYGRISRYGILPNSWSLDVAGPLTWTIEDCAIVYERYRRLRPARQRHGRRSGARLSRGLDGGVRGLRIAVIRDAQHAVPADEAVTAGIEDVASVLEGRAPFSWRSPASAACALPRGDNADQRHRAGDGAREGLHRARRPDGQRAAPVNHGGTSRIAAWTMLPRSAGGVNWPSP